MTQEYMSASDSLSNAKSIALLNKEWDKIKLFYPYLISVYQSEKERLIDEEQSIDKIKLIFESEVVLTENKELRQELTTALRLLAKKDSHKNCDVQEINMFLDKHGVEHHRTLGVGIKLSKK